jgi:hypothetical protein
MIVTATLIGFAFGLFTGFGCHRAYIRRMWSIERAARRRASGGRY